MKKTTKEKAIRNDPHPDPSVFAVYMIQGEEPPALEPAALEYQALPARHSHCYFQIELRLDASRSPRGCSCVAAASDLERGHSEPLALTRLAFAYGRSPVRGTQESDRTASLAPAEIKVRT